METEEEIEIAAPPEQPDEIEPVDKVKQPAASGSAKVVEDAVEGENDDDLELNEDTKASTFDGLAAPNVLSRLNLAPSRLANHLIPKSPASREEQQKFMDLGLAAHYADGRANKYNREMKRPRLATDKELKASGKGMVEKLWRWDCK